MLRDYSQLVDLVGKSGNEEIYKCPFCIEVRGKEDDEGKLYFNTLKEIGHCFKCGSVVVDKKHVKSADVLQRKYEDYLKNNLSPIGETLKKYNKQKFDLNHWTVSIEQNSKVREYMESRGISLNTLEKFNVRACESPKLGVVFINKLQTSRYTDFFQIRNLVGDIRHMSMKDTVKPVCWLENISSKDVVLVEGFTSGLSVYEHNNSLSPIVTTGKSLSDIQVSQITEKYKKVNFNLTICYDGGFFEDALKAAKALHKSIVGINIYLVNLPRDKDPNDISKDTFMECFNARIKYNPLSLTTIRNIVYRKKVT